MQPVQVVKVYGRKVWVEGDMMGDKHVMVQHDAPGCEPFCYCSFGYDYAYTDNASIRAAADRMALSLGATEPVEHREREFSPSEDTTAARLAAAEQMAQALSQMLTHMGMDEDEWNAKTFSDARASLAAWEAAT